MPNKTVPSWTQVPVTANELISIHYDRLVAGSTNVLTVVYEVKDSLAVVRFVHTLAQQVATYPITLAAVLSSINAAEGT